MNEKKKNLSRRMHAIYNNIWRGKKKHNAHNKKIKL